MAVVCAVVLASLSGPVFAEAPAPTGDPAPAKLRAANAYFGDDVASDSTTQAFVSDRKPQDTVTLGATAWF